MSVVRIEEKARKEAAFEEQVAEARARGARPRSHRTRRILRFGTIGLLLLIGGAVLVHWLMDRWSHVYVADSHIAADVITVSSEVEGRVTAIPVVAGDRVARGDLLVGIDSRKIYAWTAAIAVATAALAGAFFAMRSSFDPSLGPTRLLFAFEVVVIDDREKFANRERFPDSEQVIAADFGATLASLKITRGTYIVIITRGHQYDEEALMEVAESPAPYIGMIGSRRRVQAVRNNLENVGIDPAKLDRVRAPIGLEIGAETPEEIAVSIMAEIIAVRRGGRGLPMSVIARDRELRLHR